MRVSLLILALLVLALAAQAALAQTETATTQPSNTTLSEMVGLAFENPRVAVVIGIEFLLGAALGYLAVKVVRYVLAFIGILLLGSALSVWSLGGSVEEMAKRLGMEVVQLAPLLKQIFFTIGLTIVGPASLGFIVGFIIAMIKK